MGKFYDNIDQELINKRDSFLKKIESDMHYTLNRKSDTLSFDWLDEIEKACPFIDNIVRHPKVTLVKDAYVVEVGKAKKITVDSVKDLSKHSDYIEDIDEKDDVKVSKILDVRSDESYNIYENRFLYTLIKDLDKFIYDKEKELANLDMAEDKVLEYSSTTISNDEEIAKKINKAIFPGTQGGPLMHVIAGKAVCFGEALKKDFKIYQENVVKNSKKLAEEMVKKGFKLVSSGTDNHLMLVDLRNFEVTGKELEKNLDEVHITVNKNAIPNDPQSPFVTSGIRIGTPAITTRGFKEADMEKIAECIYLTASDHVNNSQKCSEIVSNLCNKYPIY